MKHIFLFHHYNGYLKAPQCYVIRTLSVLLIIVIMPDDVQSYLAETCSLFLAKYKVVLSDYNNFFELQ